MSFQDLSESVLIPRSVLVHSCAVLKLPSMRRASSTLPHARRWNARVPRPRRVGAKRSSRGRLKRSGSWSGPARPGGLCFCPMRCVLVAVSILLALACAPAPPSGRSGSGGFQGPKAGASGFPAVAKRPIGTTMRAHFINVGQGDSTLLEFPCGAILVDTGGELNDEYDGVAALQTYLEAFFANRTDLKGRLTGLILPHPHIDHTRGADMVIDKFKPFNIVTDGIDTGSGAKGQEHAEKWGEEEVAKGEGAFTAVKIGDIPPGGLVTPAIDPIDCKDIGIDPQIHALWGASDLPFKNLNNHSIVLRVDYGHASFMLMGDLEKEGIAELIEKQPAATLDVDALKVGHHGSYNATTDALLRRLTPEVAVIEMGPASRQITWSAYAYGHPRREAIDLLIRYITKPRQPEAIKVPVGVAHQQFVEQEISVAIYGTGWDGTVILQADANGSIRAIVHGLTSEPVPPH